MELKQYLYLIRKRILIIIAVPILVTSIYVAVRFITYQPVYESYTTMYIMGDNNTEANEPISYENIILNEQLTNDYKELIKSKSITREVISQLNLKDLTPQKLANNINVSSKNKTRLIEIRVIDHSPQRVKLITDKISYVFMEKATELMNINNINIVDHAEVPVRPIRSNIMHKSTTYFIISLFLSVGFILLLEYKNSTIKTIDEAEQYLKLDVLGVIPTFKIK